MDIKYIDGELLKVMFERAAAELGKNKELVNDLNVFPVPDGDTGTNMFLSMNSAIEEMHKVESKRASDVAKAMAKGLLMGARGNSGVILSQIFRGFAKGCGDKQHLSSIDFARALNDSAEAAYKAVMKPVEGTILTVIRKTGEKAMEHTLEEIPIADLMAELIARAEETLDKTPEMLDVLKSAGVVDAGGMGLLIILRGFRYSFAESADEEIEKYRQVHHNGLVPGAAKVPASATGRKEEIRFAYCTEFMVNIGDSTGEDLQRVKAEIEKMGDSMVFVEDEGIVKIHIHTNNPGLALEEGLKAGPLTGIKIENMREQHDALTMVKGSQPVVEAGGEEVDERYAVIAVSMGEGLTNILKDLGVSIVIEGGQTMNPSTEDLVKAIDDSSSDQIIILPNNSNIILAANQAKELSSRNVTVVPTKSVPEGISAMIGFDPDADIDENIASMTGAAQAVRTVQITYAVRDTVFNDKPIEAGDILGISGKEISVIGKNVEDVLVGALKKAISDDSELITVYYGDDVDSGRINDLREMLESEFDGVDVEIYFGGQPIYYYICSVE